MSITADKSVLTADEQYMRRALELAREAYDLGEVPVGAIVVNGRTGEVIAEAYNLREHDRMATAHAEIIAIEEACKKLGGWRLSGCTLYVTLEPCPMCAGAIVNSRIDRVVFGAADPLAGCCGTLINFNSYPFNHSFKITPNICSAECKELLSDFFEDRRRHEV